MELRVALDIKVLRLPLPWFVLLAMTFSFSAQQSRATPAATTTTLATTSGSKTITSGGSVASGSVINLTATVKSGNTAVTTGQVNFCDASAKYCTDIHLLGMAQLTKAGTAVLRFHPGIGSHSYKAVFLGTKGEAMSYSIASLVTVIGAHPTATTIAQSGNPGNYTLTATVTGFGSQPGLASPTGSVSFRDTTTGNSVLSTAVLGVGAPGFNFQNPNAVNPQTGLYPFALATGDFNADGIPDVALANLMGNTITILLGNGNGTFTEAKGSPVSVGAYPRSVVIGDFNGDDLLDLAVANETDSTVTILLGAGNGTFTQATGSPVPVGANPDSLSLGDFNGDGISDLAVVNGGDRTVTILLGTGNGSFTRVASSSTVGNSQLASPISSASADFNGDGIPDLAVANYGDSTVSILLGKGDGTFKEATNSPVAVGIDPFDVTAGDFNGDGIPDLAVANYEEFTVTILLGKGNGTFSSTANSPVSVGEFPKSVAVGDFNGDGIPDLVSGGDYGVTILFGVGDGTFTLPPTYPPFVGSTPSFVVVADLNGDGNPDVVTANTGDNTAGVLLSHFSQTGTATVSGISPSGLSPHQVNASYPGNGEYAPSISAPTALTVQVLAPVISPGSGSYSSAKLVTITDATPNATIYYALSGNLSTNGFLRYTGPIKMSPPSYELIQAYAVETGYARSLQTAATYSFIAPPTAMPVISLAPGVYSTPQTVTLTDATAGATIYYTTNGSWPTTSSAKYAGPFTVSSSETLVATAIANGYSMSNAASAQFIIGSSPTMLIYTVAGNHTFGYSGNGGPATAADLNYPLGTAIDAAGNIYIADSTNNVIRKVAAGTGIITTFAGTGIAGYSGDGKAAITAQLRFPSAVTLDSAGNLYIADTSNSVIRKVTAATGVITTFAGNGTYGYSGDNGPATSAELSTPMGVACDPAGNLFIADPGTNRIREVFAATGTIAAFAGNGRNGYLGDGGPAISASLGFPQGIATDASRNLFIADGYNNVIRIVNANGIISTVAGNGYGASTYQGGYSGDGGLAKNAELNRPEAVNVDNAGNIYFADTYNQVIRKVTASSGIITTVVGNTEVCNSLGGDGGSATSAGLCFPYGISIDKSGNLFITDSSSSLILEATALGLPPKTPTTAPTFSVAAGTYAGPQTVTISDSTPGATIHVAFNGASLNTARPGYNGPINVSGNVTIKAIAVAPGHLPSSSVTAAYTIASPPTAVISTIAGNGIYGFSGVGGPATNAEIGYAQGITLDHSGNLYFTDTANNVVWSVSAKTGIASIIAGNGTAGYGGDGGPAVNAELRSPNGLAVDKAGNVYIADSQNNKVRKVAATTGLITTFAGNGNSGISSFVGDGGPAIDAELSSPLGLVLDSAGNLYITDSNDNRVRMVSATSGIISTVVGNGEYGFGGDGGPAVSAILGQPTAIAIDTAGDLYIATPYLGRVRKVTAKTGIITTVAGNGNYGNSGDGGHALAAEVSAQGIAVDIAGNLYISGWPGEVRKVAASTGMITRIAGNGYSGFSGDGGSATLASLSGPQGIAIDATGSLFIADQYNSRVRKVRFPAPAATPVFSLAGGTYIGAHTVAITDATASATIYYTTNGTIPTATSTKYTSAITISATEVLKAVAVAPGYTASVIASANYTIQQSTLAIMPSPTSLTFASTAVGATTSAQVVTVMNTGTAVVTLGTTSFIGPNPKSFIKSATTCGTTLAAGASCTMSIEFKPAVTGALSASLAIADNASGSPQLVALKGTALPALVMGVSPANLTFASTVVGAAAPPHANVKIPPERINPNALGAPKFSVV